MIVRLKDVAERAGVAVNTASTVLNRRPNSWASKETVARVFRAARELGYTPNQAARGLKMGVFNTFGLLISNLQSHYFMTLAEQLEAGLRSRGANLIIESSQNKIESEEGVFRSILERQIDGLVACPMDFHGLVQQFKSMGGTRKPSIFLGEEVGESTGVDTFLSDFRDGIVEAVRQLIVLGHRRMRFITWTPPDQPLGYRPKFFLECLERNGISTSESSVVHAGIDHDVIFGAALEVLRKPVKTRPTAVIAFNDDAALAVMRAAAQLGISVPDELSIVGVDDIPLCQKLPVTLSSIHVSMAEMADQLVALLFERRAQKTPATPRTVIFSSKFIARESIGPAPADLTRSKRNVRIDGTR